MQNGIYLTTCLYAWKLRAACTLVALVSFIVFALPVQAKDTTVDFGALAPLESFRECDVCPEMIVMPPGDFMMGAIPGESVNPFDIYGPLDATDFKMRIRGPDEIDIIPNEHPRHPVEMDIPYAIGLNEVTHAEWMTCVEAGGCGHVPDHRLLTPNGYKKLGPNHPAIYVSYLDAREYTAWLNSKTFSLFPSV